MFDNRIMPNGYDSLMFPLKEEIKIGERQVSPCILLPGVLEAGCVDIKTAMSTGGVIVFVSEVGGEFYRYPNLLAAAVCAEVRYPFPGDLKGIFGQKVKDYKIGEQEELCRIGQERASAEQILAECRRKSAAGWWEYVKVCCSQSNRDGRLLDALSGTTGVSFECPHTSKLPLGYFTGTIYNYPKSQDSTGKGLSVLVANSDKGKSRMILERIKENFAQFKDESREITFREN